MDVAEAVGGATVTRTAAGWCVTSCPGQCRWSRMDDVGALHLDGCRWRDPGCVRLVDLGWLSRVEGDNHEPQALG